MHRQQGKRRRRADFFEDLILVIEEPQVVEENEDYDPLKDWSDKERKKKMEKVKLKRGQTIGRDTGKGKADSEKSDQANEGKDVSSRESTVKRGFPDITKRKAGAETAIEKSVSPSRNILVQSDLSLITTTMEDTTIRSHQSSHQSSEKIQSQEHTSSTMGTTSRIEMYDQHQDAALETRREQPGRDQQGLSNIKDQVTIEDQEIIKDQ